MYLPSYRSCIALMRPALVEARAVDADLVEPAFLRRSGRGFSVRALLK